MRTVTPWCPPRGEACAPSPSSPSWPPCPPPRRGEDGDECGRGGSGEGSRRCLPGVVCSDHEHIKPPPPSPPPPPLPSSLEQPSRPRHRLLRPPPTPKLGVCPNAPWAHAPCCCCCCSLSPRVTGDGSGRSTARTKSALCSQRITMRSSCGLCPPSAEAAPSEPTPRPPPRLRCAPLPPNGCGGGCGGGCLVRECCIGQSPPARASRNVF